MVKPSQLRHSLRGNATTSARDVTMGSGAADRAAAFFLLILTTLYKIIITVIITAFRIGV